MVRLPELILDLFSKAQKKEKMHVGYTYKTSGLSSSRNRSFYAATPAISSSAWHSSTMRRFKVEFIEFSAYIADISITFGPTFLVGPSPSLDADYFGQEVNIPPGVMAGILGIFDSNSPISYLIVRTQNQKSRCLGVGIQLLHTILVATCR